MADPVVIEGIEKTCDACPSQWDAVTPDGRRIYIRYRWGTLQVQWWDDDPLLAAYIYHAQIGDPFDGVLAYAELREKLAGTLQLPPAETRNDPLTGQPEDKPHEQS